MATKDTFNDEGSVSSHSVHSDDSHSNSGGDLKSVATETVETDTRSDELVVTGETQSLTRLKGLLIIILSLAALTAAVLTYYFATAAETDSFQIKVDANVHEIEETVLSRWINAQTALESLAMTVTSASVAGQASLPSFLLPFFQTHGQEIMELSSGALAVGWCPMVPTELGMTLPIRQLAPPELATIGYDLLTDPATEELFLEMLVAKESVQSGLVSIDFLELPAGEFHTLLMQPMYNDTSMNKIVVGTTFSALSWGPMFDGILATDSGKMDVIVKNTCNDVQLLYELAGSDSTYLGSNSDVDLDSSNMETTLWLESANSSSSHACQYSLSIFPSQDFEEEQTSMKPLVYAILVAFAIGVVLAVFVCYDRFVEARQERVLSKAARSNAIVASLFPSNVRDRILKEAEDKVDAKTLKKRQSSVGAKAQLKDFLNDGMGLETVDKEISDSKPIADLFPHTTVLFGDVAGFTAWSSIREPSQVFILLETIYNAFDNIARRRRVFKVETIGDCYVAVSGLPEPRKDHAITMVRFARDLLTTMNTLTRQLEVVLGPDTGDLAMRIGLHSGPVTAGVLRGQNCRFQLFGDTVNTAARMESNGVRDAVHISEETANLVREAGKEHWLVQREDKIVAKGKGEMTTYFIKSKRIGSSPGSVTTGGSVSDAASRAESSDVSTGIHGLPKRIRRLVIFNADLLGRLLKSVVARRTAQQLVQKRVMLAVPTPPLLIEKSSVFSSNGKMVLDEVQDIIALPKFNAKAALKQQDPKDVVLDGAVIKQLNEYVTVLATMYRKEVPFHNFEHASHVTMSVAKLLSRIVSPDSVISSSDTDTNQDEMVKKLHEHTYGITSDPMTQFVAVVAALIHDVDHTGVPNSQLVKEGNKLAQVYKNKSVAEQNSVDLAWDLLMDEGFKDLRETIYTTDEERIHFRQLLVNLVMATDICDKELGAKRKARWAKAFAGTSEDKAGESHSDAVNRKATIVLEHLIQASDVAHTMQHWQIYRKWNEKFFEENMKAFSDGRAEKDPSTYWYEGELGFFDYYIIPLAKKLKECGVFGVSSDEYLIYAEKNRQEWAARGQEAVAEMSAKYLPSLREEDDDELSLGDDYAAHSEGSSSFDENSALVMDQQTIHNVSESWEILRRLPNYEEQAGTILFTVLFAKCPAAKVLFGFPIDMDPNSDTIKKSKRFLMHATYMIQMLTKALELLGPDSEMLAKILADLGKKHVRLGVKEAFFPMMGEALMEALAQMLGDKLTEEMKSSWGIVYDALSSEMITAMNNDKAVLLSWNKLKMMPNYQEVAGVILFQKLFEDCPEAKILFGFPADMDVFSEAMLTSRRFKGHAAYFIEMLDKALDMVEAKQIGENMKRLGAMHVTFGVQEAYFPIMGEALFHTLRTTLRSAWNDNTEAAWRDVYGKLSFQMVSAMKESTELKY